MRHPTEGVLRRLLDEPAGVAEQDRQHVAGCDRCAGTLASVRDDARHAAAALLAAGEPDVDAAWTRLEPLAATAPAPHRTRTRPRLRRPAVAGLAVALALTGAGTAAAGGWLQVFQTEQVAPLRLTAADLLALPDLTAYGDLALSGSPDLRTVADAAAAEAATGLEVPAVAELPRGVAGRPTYQVGDEVMATFTFSAERAAGAASSAGEPLPAPPPGLDGSPVRLVAGPGVAQLWESSSGVPALLVGTARAPRAFSSPGVPFEVVRDYLLGLPGIPDEVAAQLRTFAADGRTLPLPVPADRVTTRSVEVDGAPATVLATRDRTLSAVVWVREGVVTVVAGSLDEDEVLSVARELR